MNNTFKSLCFTVAALAMPFAAQSVPITYDITSGTAPGFSGSWLHAGTTQMGSSGYFANGAKARINGSLTLDMDNLSSTSGLLSGSGDFGLGSDTWTIDITGASQGTHVFVGGQRDLISLDYSLTSVGGHSSNGTFYFADLDFNGGTIDDGPNYIDDNNLFLWGNNWVNKEGASDRADFLGGLGNVALGLDLYGKAADVPEPGMLALLAMGLLGFGVKRRMLNA